MRYVVISDECVADAIHELVAQQDLSNEQIVRQAIALYRLHAAGNVNVISDSPGCGGED